MAENHLLKPDNDLLTEEHQTNRWYYVLCLLVTATFLLEGYLHSYTIGLLVLTWIGIYRFQFKWDKDLKVALFYAGFYGLHVMGTLWSDNMPTVTHDLESKASILALPLIYIVFTSLSQRQVEGILTLFVGVVLTAAVWTLGKATGIYLKTGQTDQFFYHELGGLINMHAIYMSMYVCFAILILLQWLVSVWDKHGGLWLQISLIVTVFFLFGYNILLSARMPTLALCLVVFAGILKVFYDRRGLATGISIIVLTSGILIAGILLSPVNKQRYKEAFNGQSVDASRDLQDGRTLRLMKWDCCLDILKDNWLLGVGTGDIQDNLDQCYKAKKYTYLTDQDRHYNAHNQYFQTWLGLGIVGLLWFVALLIYPMYAAWQRQYYLHLGFIVMFAIVCTTESTLPVHKGVVFFMFFSMVLLFGKVPWPWRNVHV
jgi:O-antigen ligase